MAQAPHVRAIVDIDDRLTPGLSKIMAELDKLALGAANGLDNKLGASVLKLDDSFKRLGLTAKEALNPAMVKEFGQQTGILNTELNKVTNNMSKAGERARHFREMLRGAAESAKLLAAFEAPHLLREGIAKGGELNQVIQGEMPAAGVPVAERQYMIDRARDISSELVMSSTADVIKTALEIRGELVPHKQYATKAEEMRALTEESMHLAEVAGKANKALIVSGVETGFSPTDLKNLVKFSEHVGKADDPKFMEELINQYVKVKQVDRSFIESGKFFDFIVNAKASGITLSNDFLIKTLPVWLAGGQAPRLGNEVYQTMKTLAGGNVLKGTAHWLTDMGLITPDQLEETGPGSFHVKGGVKGAELLMTDPQRWSTEVLAPLITAKGYKAEDIAKSLEKYMAEDELNKKSGKIANARTLLESNMRATVVDLLLHAIANAKFVEKNKEKVDHALGIDAMGLTDKNAPAALEQFYKSVENFAAVLTEPIMTDAAAALDAMAHSLAGFTKSMAEFFEKNPMAGKLIGGGAIAGGALGTAYLFSSLGKLATAGPELSGAATKLSIAADKLNAAGGRAGAGAGGGAETAAGASTWGAAFAKTLAIGASFLSLEALAFMDMPGEEEQRDKAKDITAKAREKYGDEVVRKARDAYQPWYARTSTLDASDSQDLEYIRRYLADNDPNRSYASRHLGLPGNRSDWTLSDQLTYQEYMEKVRKRKDDDLTPFVTKDAIPPAQVVQFPKLPEQGPKIVQLKEVDRQALLQTRQANSDASKPPPPQKVDVQGVAEVRQQTSITVDLGVKATRILEKAQKVGLTSNPALLGKPQAGPTRHDEVR